MGINCSILTQTPIEFIDVVWFMMNTEGEEDWELFATVAWCLWNNRNKVRHGEAGKNGKSIAVEARNYWAEVRAVKPSFGRPSKPKITHTHWLPPPQGWYKVNVDVAVFKDQGQCGIGVVIRNNQGLIMGAMCKLLEFPPGALEAEAKAMEAGIGLA